MTDNYKDKLSPEAYKITREGGTEPAFTGKYYQNTHPPMTLHNQIPTWP